ncbi:MAG: hypothetical protein BGO13_04095 [Burkholderiales bacterium 66-5]|uniref:phenol hydroxylase subunit n=1 Tax=Comamonas sp. SCN 65-56 TaxID=1660095 RepID=UPI000869DBF5|nr:phenol hydroxylase subunit [Comamonas sp. SCN 65-56]ODS93213.1 MAG: hypothetical protein ABS45_03170 [Comamonas sp. SCN 65-56]OJU90889.1 MAG: hypothetical protein BGO13_04095 [Burkholderiales bacterium 66-5]
MNPELLPHCDVTRKYINVLGRRDNGLVEFEFSMGWPELTVELMLPEQAFAEFCRTHQVKQHPGQIDTHPLSTVSGDTTHEH